MNPPHYMYNFTCYDILNNNFNVKDYFPALRLGFYPRKC